MPTQTETQTYTLTLKQLLAAGELRIPDFHRNFRWGEVDHEFRAVDYAKDVLFNEDAHDLFGTIIVSSFDRMELDTKQVSAAQLYVGDGQHRLVTVVLAARALLERAQDFLESDVSRQSNCADLDYYRGHSLLRLAANARIQVRVGTTDAAQMVGEHLGLIVKRCGNERRELDVVDKMGGRPRVVNVDAVRSSYLQILRFLSDMNLAEYTQMVDAFINKIDKLQILLVHLQPKRGYRVSDIELQRETCKLLLQNLELTVSQENMWRTEAPRI